MAREKIQLRQNQGRLSDENHAVLETDSTEKPQIRLIETSIRTLLEQKRNLEAGLKTKNKSSSLHNSFHGPARDESEELGAEIADLKTKIHDLEVEHADLTNENLELRGKRATLKKYSQYIEEENRDLKEEIMDKEEEMKALVRFPTASSERYCKFLEETNECLRVDLTASKEDHVILQERNSSLRREISYLAEAVDDDKSWKEYIAFLEAENQRLGEEKTLWLQQKKLFKDPKKGPLIHITDEIAELEKTLALQKPLVELAISIRLRFFAQNRAKLFASSTGRSDQKMVESGNQSAHCGDILADTAILALMIVWKLLDYLNEKGGQQTPNSQGLY